jgi:hypothetical protein
MNPVVALSMKEGPVLDAVRAAQHAGDAIMKTPTRVPGDTLLAYGAEAGLYLREKAKRTVAWCGDHHVEGMSMG